jgi:hypothetical protein
MGRQQLIHTAGVASSNLASPTIRLAGKSSPTSAFPGSLMAGQDVLRLCSPVFQRHYPATRVDKQDYRLARFRCVVLNPLRVKGRARHAGAWQWSSDRATVREEFEIGFNLPVRLCVFSMKNSQPLSGWSCSDGLQRKICGYRFEIFVVMQ